MRDPSNLRRTVKEIADDTGLGHLSPNELRHTSTSLSVDAGSTQAVADMLWHRDVRTLAATYRHKVHAIVDATDDPGRMLARTSEHRWAIAGMPHSIGDWIVTLPGGTNRSGSSGDPRCPVQG